jgi:hypothetical protein
MFVLRRKSCVRKISIKSLCVRLIRIFKKYIKGCARQVWTNQDRNFLLLSIINWHDQNLNHWIYESMSNLINYASSGGYELIIII